VNRSQKCHRGLVSKRAAESTTLLCIAKVVQIMTKLALLAILALFVLAPTATAHGAPASRDIDSRLVTDNAQGGDYGPVSEVPNPLVANGAVDLLAVDVREAYGPSGEAGLWGRIVYQGGDEGSHRIELAMDVNGVPVTRFFESADLNTWIGDADFTAPEVFPVGDGYPRALEFFLSSGLIGAGAIENVMVTSKVGGGTGDLAPGTYQTVAGVPAVVPTDDSATASYTMDGPDELLTISGQSSIDLSSSASFEVTVENLVGEAQFITFATVAGFGGNLVISPDSLALGASETGTVSVTTTAPVSGNAAITAISDLGGRSAMLFAYTTETIPLADTDGLFGLSELLPPGAAYEFTFTTAGSNPYHCHPHPFMTGDVTVLAGPNPAGPTTYNVFIFDNGLQSTEAEMGFLDEVSQSKETTVYEGDTVRWTNTGTHPDNHNVSPGSHEGGAPHEHGTSAQEPSEETPAPFGLLLLSLAFLVRRRK
jgi:MYXO-CTERM domain-containing protein